MRHGWLPLHPTCCIRREVMMRLGFYNESYKISADSDLLVRYLMTGGLSTDRAKRRKMWEDDMESATVYIGIIERSIAIK
ncbi:hypothetical protein AB9N12_19530 [Bacteroides sp. AN502(2024)]